MIIFFSVVHLAAKGQWSDGRGLHWHPHLHPHPGHHQTHHPSWGHSQKCVRLPVPGGAQSPVHCQQGQ